MALKVTLFDHHFVSLPDIYLFYGIYNYILLFPVSLVIIIIIIIVIIIIIIIIIINALCKLKKLISDFNLKNAGINR